MHWRLVLIFVPENGQERLRVLFLLEIQLLIKGRVISI